MKLKHFINELNKFDGFKPSILKNCSKYLKLLYNDGISLYRGVNTSDKYLIHSLRTTRKPKDMSIKFHNILNKRI